MPERAESRFDAESVQPLITVNQQRRLEMQFSDAERRKHVVSLPLGTAVEFARMICDLYEGTPFLKGQADKK